MTSKKFNIVTIFIILIVVGGVYLATIREGHNWGGDFSMYIHHAKNIAEGIDYKDTGYIYNPFYPSLGPKTYPPVFPLLLSPIYKWFGLNLTIMKIEITLIFVASLLMIFLIFRNQLSFQYSITMLALIGFSPYFWNFKDDVLSDIPFLFFVYLSLFFIDQTYQLDKSKRDRLLYAILVGLSIYLSYGTKSIGILLIPCLLIYDLIRFKRPTQFAIISTLLFVFFMVLQNIFLHSDSSYFDQFVIDPKIILRNLISYTKSLAVLWDNGASKILHLALFIIISGLAIVGYLARVMNRITIFEIFLLLYVSIVIVWPSDQAIRFLIPVIPFYIFYAFVGIKVTFSQQRKIERVFFIVLIIAIFVSYGAKYTKIDYGPIREGIGKKESIELFNYIKGKTDERDVFIFEKPRVLALFTGRSASAYHRPQDDSDLWNYLYEINATCVIVSQVFHSDQPFLGPFVERHKDSFREVYSNLDFKVYRIKKDVLCPNGR